MFVEEASSIMASMPTTFCIFFFFFTALFSVFSLFVYILRIKLLCNCDVCRCYLSCNWLSEFPNLSDWYTHLLRKSSAGTIHVHVLGNIITANPDNVEHILKTKFENYPKGKPFSMILGDLLGRGIFNVDGDAWLFQRKMASLELGSVSVRTFANEIVAGEIQTRLIPLLSSFSDRKEQVLDLQDVFRRFSYDNICKFSFGLDPGCLQLSLPISNFAEAFDLATKLSAERAMTPSPIIWKLKRILKLGSEKKLEEAIKMVNTLAQEMIKQRRKLGFADKKDLLSRFMASVDDDSYLRDIVVSFLLAGRDTVAAALTSFFWLLSNNPKVESSIREEIKRVMGQKKEHASFEVMKEMHYVHAALHESLRLFPPVQFDSKFAEEDDVLPDGKFVRKGTRVSYHPYAMGRMERIWGPDCLEFKPERWLTTNGLFSPENPFKYPVFQAGLRICLGKELALMEMKSVVVALVNRFQIRVVGPNEAPKFAPGLTANLKGGLPVRVHIQERI